MPVLWIILHFTAAGLLTAWLNRILLVPWRQAANSHWAERARILWPIRSTAAANVIWIPLVLVELHVIGVPATVPLLVACGIAGLLGSLLGTYPFDHALFPQLGLRDWCQQVILAWSIRFGVLTILLGAGLLMPEHAGWKMLLVAGGYLVLHFLFQFGVFLKLLGAVKFLRPASPRLRQIVEPMAARMNVPVHGVWQTSGVAANAFAFPTTREVAFSNRLLEICTDEELGAICAHELAHLAESKAVLAGRLLGSLSLFPFIFIFPSFHWLGPFGVLPPCLGMIGIARFSRQLSQRMEKHADQTARTEQVNEGVYALALEKLYRANQAPAVNVNNRQIHPHLYDRMLAAGITPDYPRPAGPRRTTLIGWAMFLAFFILCMLVGMTLGFRERTSNMRPEASPPRAFQLTI